MRRSATGTASTRREVAACRLSNCPPHGHEVPKREVRLEAHLLLRLGHETSEVSSAYIDLDRHPTLFTLATDSGRAFLEQHHRPESQCQPEWSLVHLPGRSS